MSVPSGGSCSGGPGCNTGIALGYISLGYATAGTVGSAGAVGAAADGGLPASAAIGRTGSEMYVQPGTNAAARIGGRQFTGHALDQMQGRGIMPSMVFETLTNGAIKPGRAGATVYFSDYMKVITNPSGSVKTVMWQ